MTLVPGNAVVITESAALDNTPAYLSLVYNRMRLHWQLAFTLMQGTIAMRNQSKLYLPQHPAESDENYKHRLSKTVLRNFYERTVTSLTGKVFAKELILKDVNPTIEPMLENVDLTGRDFNIFAKDVFYDAIAMGISYILIDYPKVQAGITLEEERLLAPRPYMRHVQAVDMIGFKSEFIGGVQTLTEVRIRESYVARGEDYAEFLKYRIRILRPGSFELWESDNNNVWSLVDSGTSLPQISLVPIITKRVGFWEGRPPLEDLAWMNLEHYQIRSDQRVALSVASFPILAASGWKKDEDETVEIGPKKMLATMDPAGKFYYVETSGASLEAGDHELSKLEDQMRVFGLQFEMSGGKSAAGGKVGAETATGRNIDQFEAASALHSWACSLQDGLNNALGFMASWLNLDPETAGAVLINEDYSLASRNAAELDILIKARGLGDLSRETLISELVRRGLLDEDFDVEAELDKLLEEQETLNAFVQSELTQINGDPSAVPTVLPAAKPPLGNNG